MNKSRRMIAIGLIVLVVVSGVVFFAMPRIDVTGTGTVNAYPDEAQLSFTIQTQDASAANAAARNGASTSGVLDALRALGVKTGNGSSYVKLTGYSLGPVYDPNNYTKIVGYQATTSLEVVVTGGDLTTVGSILDAIVRAGVNQIDSVTFTFTDAIYSPLRAQAYSKAVQDASNQAYAIVGSIGGLMLGPVSASTSYQYPTPIYMQNVAISGPNAKTPLPVGNEQVTASVDITYLYL